MHNLKKVIINFLYLYIYFSATFSKKIGVSVDIFFKAFPFFQNCFFNFLSSITITFPSNLLLYHIPINIFFPRIQIPNPSFLSALNSPS